MGAWAGARARAWLAPALGALALAAGGGPAAAVTTLSAGWGAGCGHGTCFNDQGTYSVVFSKGSFSGPVDLSRFFLDRSVLGTMGSQFFAMSFTLNGKTIGSWGNWNMSAVAGDTLSLWGSDLVWDPADGDLVLVLELVTPDGQKLGNRWFDGWYEGDGPPWARGRAEIGEDGSGPPGPPNPPFPPGNPPPPSDGPGDTPPPPGNPPPPTFGPAGVPEPSAWLLMIAGFGLAGAALRRRRCARAG